MKAVRGRRGARARHVEQRGAAGGARKTSGGGESTADGGDALFSVGRGRRKVDGLVLKFSKNSGG